MNTPSISIIVPVYKVEKYIKRCIDSIIAQTFHNWELLLIDDGSQDNSGIICDEYAKEDTRIKVFHKLNGGVSSARNMGLDNVSSNWVTFVDSDDALSPNYLQNMYKEVQTSDDNIIFVHSGAKMTKENYTVGDYYRKDYYKGNCPIVLLNNLEGYPFSKLFRTDIINNDSIGGRLRFDENMRICEDMVFVLNYLHRATGQFVFTPDTEYLYTLDNGSSAMHQDLGMEDIEATHYKAFRILDSYNALLNKYLSNYNTSKKMSEWISERVAVSVFGIYKLSYSHKERIKRLKDDWNDRDASILLLTKADFIRKRCYRLLINKRFFLFDTISLILSVLWKLKI